MTYLQLWRLLTMRWRVSVVCAFLGAIVALIWAYSTVPAYEATAQLMINVRAPETLGQGGVQTMMDQVGPDYLSTQVDVIKSDRIARLVVQRLNLGSNTTFLEAMGWKGRGSIEDFLATRLGYGLKVTPGSALSRVLDISYRASSGRFAAAAANAFAQAYVDTTLDLQAQPSRDNANWYQRRLAEVQRELSVAQERLSTRQKELGISSPSNQANPEDIRLQGISAQIANAQTADAAARSRTTGGALPAILADPVIAGLQSDLAKLESQRAQLATTAGPNNPDYKQVVGQISALEKQVAAQKARLTAGTAVAAQQAAAAVSNLSAAADAEKKRAIDARAQHDEIGVLEQDVRNLQLVYEQMAARRSQLDLMGESTQSNVAVLSPASNPEKAVWPRKGLMLIGGFFLGGVAGLILIIGRELIDQRLRASSDYEAWLAIPDLGRLRLEVPQTRGLLYQGMALLPFYRAKE